MYYIGNFKHLTDQEQNNERNRRHGDFSMLIEAESTQTALALFRRKLIDFRNSSSLFSGECRIYITQLIEFEKMPNQEAVLLNLKSFVGDPTLPYIACVVPTQQSDACSIHDWQNNQPTIEGQQETLFLIVRSSQSPLALAYKYR